MNRKETNPYIQPKVTARIMKRWIFLCNLEKNNNMKNSVNTYFKRFMEDSVNLSPIKTVRARQSREWLIDQLRKLSEMGKIPPLYKEVSPMFFGSFSK